MSSQWKDWERGKKKQLSIQQSQGFQLTCVYRPMTIKLQQSTQRGLGGLCLLIGLSSSNSLPVHRFAGLKEARWPADSKLRNSHHVEENHTCTFTLDCPQSSKREPTHTLTHTQHIRQHHFPFPWVHSRPWRHSGKLTFPSSSTYTVSSSSRLCGRLSDKPVHWALLVPDWLFRVGKGPAAKGHQK